MAVSYATRHKQAHKQARHGSSATEPGDAAHHSGNIYETQLVKLWADKAQLSNIRSLQRKKALKREILASYSDYIQLAINQNSGLQDDILVTVLIWAIDAGDYSKALQIAGYALGHNMAPPNGFKRNLAEVITEELSTQVIKSESPADFVDWLQQIEELTRKVDMVDVVRAKLHKALGLSVQDDDPEQALQHFHMAYQCDSKSAVTRLIKRLEKRKAASEVQRNT